MGLQGLNEVKAVLTAHLNVYAHSTLGIREHDDRLEGMLSGGVLGDT